MTGEKIQLDPAETGSLTFLDAEKDGKDGVIDIGQSFSMLLSTDNTSIFVGSQRGVTVFDTYSGLSVTNTPAATSVTPGSTASFTVEVTNNAGAVAHNTTLTFTLPEGGTASTMTPSSPSAQCSQTANVVTCLIGTLAQDAAESISIATVAPATEGTLSASATVAADEVDNDTADNTAAAAVTVSNSATPPPAPTTPPAPETDDDDDGDGGGGAFDWLTAAALAVLAAAKGRKIKL